MKSALWKRKQFLELYASKLIEARMLGAHPQWMISMSKPTKKNLENLRRFIEFKRRGDYEIQDPEAR